VDRYRHPAAPVNTIASRHGATTNDQVDDMARPTASAPLPSLTRDDTRTTLQLAVLAIALGAAQTACMALFRTGLPTPPLAYVAGLAILACATLGPSVWALNSPARVLWVGPCAMAVLLLGFALIAFGSIPVLLAAALGLVLLATALVKGGLRAAPGRALLWLLLFVAILIVCTIQIAGIKYVNYVADQLMYAGRTDGDMLMHAAMINAIRYYHFPSTGIDGLRFSRYHFGIDVLAALTSRGLGFNALLSMIVIKIPLLLPLMTFAGGWGGLVIGRSLLTGARLAALPLACGVGAIVFLLQLTPVGNLVTYSDPLLLSGVLMLLIAPTVLRILSDSDAQANTVRGAWALAILGIFLLGLAKISLGFVWAGLIAYWALRRYGLASGFWAVSIPAGLVLVPTYLLTSDQGAAGVVLFGTPFFVEIGFSQGRYFEPLRMHFQALAAIVWLALLARDRNAPLRRLLVESLVVAMLIGNLPGLLMEIPGGDAYYFIVAVAWFSIPILVALLAALPDRVAFMASGRRRLAWSAAALATLACVVIGALGLPLRFQIFMAYNTLLHTGDRDYYDVDKARGWKEDGKRAWKQYGLGVFKLPGVPQAGQSLADALAALKTEAGNSGAAYLAVQSDYWPLVSDCDGKLTYPMSVAGVPVIDGYLPVQSECPQQFSLRGYGAPPETRSDIDDAAICARARQEGFTTVLRIESLGDRSRDRKLSCP
jgi:hypothetical protein